ncbi:MAG: toll/interleukin-1 receptor domain-containing protein [Oscillospiraceae bacterium]|nr:toll/interleukin-1 receptor domain-containing protein [Oscillospiraceae bacterium]
MSIIKCKMCGGPLEIRPGDSVAECEFCGIQQTIPRLNDEKRANLYDRANHFRRNNEFDKACTIYEQILNEDGEDAEAYWSLVLCRFGIEYVEDPVSHKRVPTVHRAQFTSVFDDDNYKMALRNADAKQRGIYEAEAKAINEIQKGILAISQREDPFDVFICYKESDQNGARTRDSVLAQDLYYQLTEQGFKVFFARITLEDKLGSAYEPYIFAALNSAKVMVVVGTCAEHFNAVWVRNEWSRYLSLIKNGAKKTLIPAYRDMDPYDLPSEFSHLQAQDMSKLGFMQDLIRGISKITGADVSKTSKPMDSTAGGSGNPRLERAFIFIEDGDFKTGDEYCERVLDDDPKCAEAYLGKLMVNLKVRNRRQLGMVNTSFANDVNYKRIIRFGSDELVKEVNGYLKSVEAKAEKAPQEEAAWRQEQLKKDQQRREQQQQDQYRAEQERQLAVLEEKCRNLPTEEQIKKKVKATQPIKRLLTFAVLFCFLCWPVGITLICVRISKINNAVLAEIAKCNDIRRECAVLSAKLQAQDNSYSSSRSGGYSGGGR